ncbi:MFS transporter [Gordonia sp. CPCC 205333]|uniref:MFS transporter n=1 Tax=Gordonia sp. CPCC 205333 TaxID=3140790 RepID=UPI003AF37B11
MTTRYSGYWAAVAAALFASAWGGNEFTPLLVMYRQTSNMSAVVVDALLFTYVLGIIPTLLIAGPLSDRVGRKKLMMLAPIAAALGSLILAVGAHSAGLLAVGRVFSGVALGLSMAVGGTWIKELSDLDGSSAGAGARRAAMSLTAGFGIGAGVAGVLAQWGPWPTALPYAINVAMAIVALLLLVRVPETRHPVRCDRRRLADDFRIPSVTNGRFLTVVLLVSPWVFGACAVAYAVIPAVMTSHTAGAPIAFAALCCVAGLAAGFGIQSVGRRIDDPTGVRGVVVALVVLMVGMLLAAAAANALTLWLALVAATVLGCGYGMAMISGLLEVQRIAGPDDLAGLTAVFYSGTYLGFAAPAVMAWFAASSWAVTYPSMLVFGAVAAVVCLAVCLLGHRRYPPAVIREDSSA